MSEKTTIILTCPCEKKHIFQQPFHVEGLGMTEVQVFCPECNRLCSYEIPWNVVPGTEYRSLDHFTPPVIINKKQ